MRRDALEIRWGRVLAVALGVVLGLEAARCAGEARGEVEFIQPRVGIYRATADVPLQLWIERPRDRDRGLRVSWDGAPCSPIDEACEENPRGCEAGSTFIALEGAASPRVVPREPRWIRIAAACRYALAAEVLEGPDLKTRARVSTTIIVR